MNIQECSAQQSTPLAIFNFLANHRSIGLPLLLLGLFLLCTLLNPANGQLNGLMGLPEPVLHNFTTDNGLPSNVVHGLAQDTVGYLWLATSRGACRFDGHTFQCYSVGANPADNSLGTVQIDQHNRAWFLSESGNIYNIEDERVTPYGYNWRVQSYISDFKRPIKGSLHIDRYENLHLSIKGRGRIEITREGVFSELKGVHKENLVVFERKEDGTILFTQPQNPKTQDLLLLDPYMPFRFSVRELIGNNQVGQNFKLIFYQHNEFILTVGSKAFRITNGKILAERDFGSEIIWANTDSSNRLWIAPSSGGIYCFDDGNFGSTHTKLLLRGIVVTSMLTDMQGGSWFSTLTHGIFYSPNINITCLTQTSKLLNNRLTSVHKSKRGLVLGYEGGGISTLRGGRVEHIALGTNSPIRYIGGNPNSDGLVVCSRELYIITGPTPSEVELAAEPIMATPSADGGYWVASTEGFLRIRGGKIVLDSKQEFGFGHAVNALHEDADGTLWIGSSLGLHHLIGEQLVPVSYTTKIITHPISAICSTPNGVLWVATMGQGLIRLEDEAYSFIGTIQGLACNAIRNIFAHGDDIWVCTGRGVQRVRVSLVGGVEVLTLNRFLGLPTNDIRMGIAVSNTIHLATAEGLCIFDIDLSKMGIREVQTQIVSLIADGVAMPTDAVPLELRYGADIVRIEYRHLCYRSMGQTKFRYKLYGLDTSWIETQSRFAFFTHLPKGDYHFVVQTQLPSGTWGEQASLPFSISPPYWQTTGFMLISAFIFSIFIFWIYRLRVDAIRKRNELVNNINIYKQQSLMQQMNPHFIFNTLNSIQLYILQNEPISSHKYLTMFARLIRVTLDNSQRKTITIKEELEALRLYLELEALRLENSFSYSIDVADSNILKYRVPTLLIQPFVENSIWHGIMLKDSQSGRVTIELRGVDNHIICSIVDDGIGRKAAQTIHEQQNRSHNSLGYRITSQRIELLNTLYGNRFSISYTDPHDSEGKSFGTRVELRIPMDIEE